MKLCTYGNKLLLLITVGLNSEIDMGITAKVAAKALQENKNAKIWVLSCLRSRVSCPEAYFVFAALSQCDNSFCFFKIDFQFCSKLSKKYEEFFNYKLNAPKSIYNMKLDLNNNWAVGAAPITHIRCCITGGHKYDITNHHWQKSWSIFIKFSPKEYSGERVSVDWCSVDCLCRQQCILYWIFLFVLGSIKKFSKFVLFDIKLHNFSTFNILVN